MGMPHSIHAYAWTHAYRMPDFIENHYYDRSIMPTKDNKINLLLVFFHKSNPRLQWRDKTTLMVRTTLKRRIAAVSWLKYNVLSIQRKSPSNQSTYLSHYRHRMIAPSHYIIILLLHHRYYFDSISLRQS